MEQVDHQGKPVRSTGRQFNYNGTSWVSEIDRPARWPSMTKQALKGMKQYKDIELPATNPITGGRFQIWDAMTTEDMRAAGLDANLIRLAGRARGIMREMSADDTIGGATQGRSAGELANEYNAIMD